MRTVRFRGKSTRTGKWRYGCLLKEIGGGRARIVEVKDVPYYNTFVLPETVGQSTGLTDKKGKEIYDGDLLRGPSNRVMQVKYGEYEAWCPVDEQYMKNVGFYVVFVDPNQVQAPMPLGPTEVWAEIVGTVYDEE